MATLFILSHAPHSVPTEAKKLALAKAADCVVLIEDAVYGAGPTATPLAEPLADAASRGLRVCALEPDLRARGVVARVETVDYAGLVDLLAEHDRVVHW